jgi:hypothetical protein
MPVLNGAVSATMAVADMADMEVDMATDADKKYYPLYIEWRGTQLRHSHFRNK